LQKMERGERARASGGEDDERGKRAGVRMMRGGSERG